MIRWDDAALGDPFVWTLQHGIYALIYLAIAGLGYLWGSADGVDQMWGHIETLHATDTVAVHSHCRVEPGRYTHANPDSLWGLIVCPESYEGSVPLDRR